MMALDANRGGTAMHNRLDWQKQLVRAAMCAITVLALAPGGPSGGRGARCCRARLCGRWRQARHGRCMARCSGCRRPFAPGKAGRAGRFAGRSGGAGAELCRRGHGGDGDQPRLSWTALVLVGYALLIFSAMRLLLEALSAPGGKGRRAVSAARSPRRSGWGRCCWHAGCRGLSACFPAR